MPPRLNPARGDRVARDGPRRKRPPLLRSVPSAPQGARGRQLGQSPRRNRRLSRLDRGGPAREAGLKRLPSRMMRRPGAAADAVHDVARAPQRTTVPVQPAHVGIERKRPPGKAGEIRPGKPSPIVPRESARVKLLALTHPPSRVAPPGPADSAPGSRSNGMSRPVGLHF